MRIILLGGLAAILLASCKKEQLAPTAPIDEKVDTTAVPMYTGNFVNGPFGTVTGTAGIYKKGTSYEVRLTNFVSDNGPALHVYISKEAMPVNFMDLGSLKSTNGNQVYAIPSVPDFTLFKYVSIHCVDYNHLFGYANIK